MKVCKICFAEKNEEDFYLANYRYQESNKQSRNSYCIECEKKRQANYYKKDGNKIIRERAWRYQGIDFTVEEYDYMLARQGGGCAICGKTKNKSGRRLAVDHCHNTGRVRGILCNGCNVAIGKLNDDPDLVALALAYLRNTEEDEL